MYVLLFILVILLLMIFYPKDKRQIKREYFTNNKKNINLSLKPLIHNIPLLTSYYVGLI